MFSFVGQFPVCLGLLIIKSETMESKIAYFFGYVSIKNRKHLHKTTSVQQCENEMIFPSVVNIP